jgi:hypothetical protein
MFFLQSGWHQEDPPRGHLRVMRRIDAMDRVQLAFAYVCETFFPAWQERRTWTVKEGGILMYYGQCDDATKTILVKSGIEDEDKLFLTLIHEICHAISKEPHSRRWRRLFGEAGIASRRVGRERLAGMIEEEVRRYAAYDEPTRLDERLVYSTIQDLLLADPDLPYEKTIEKVAGLWGVDPEDVTVFPRCLDAYQETKEKFKCLLALTKPPSITA